MGFKEYLYSRFGIVLPSYIEIEEKGRVRIFTKYLANELKSIRIKVENKGINAGRIKKEYKPSTDFIQIFGFMATRNIIILKNKEQANNFIMGKSFRVDNELRATNGYVVVFYNKKAIGCGLLSNNVLISQIPKYKRIL